MHDSELMAQIEGLLFALGKPLARADIAKMTGADADAVEGALADLLVQSGRGTVLVDDGRMVELRVAPAAAGLVERVRKDEYSREIGKAGTETLSAILYRGPLSRAEIDFIRGVNSSQTIRTLTMRGLVRRVQNPKDERSFLYEPTTELLATLGATHPRDLPDYDAVREKLSALEEAYRTDTPIEHE